MKTPTSLTLLAVGGILTLAVNAHPSFLHRRSADRPLPGWGDGPIPLDRLGAGWPAMSGGFEAAVIQLLRDWPSGQVR